MPYMPFACPCLRRFRTAGGLTRHQVACQSPQVRAKRDRERLEAISKAGRVNDAAKDD